MCGRMRAQMTPEIAESVSTGRFSGIERPRDLFDE